MEEREEQEEEDKESIGAAWRKKELQSIAIGDFCEANEIEIKQEMICDQNV